MGKNYYKNIIWGIVVILFFSLFAVVTYNYFMQNRFFDLKLGSDILSSKAKESFTVEVEIKNKMYSDLDSDYGYFLSYHLRSADNKTVIMDNIRTKIEKIKPGNTKWIKMIVDTNIMSGEYIMEIDIVKEHEFWYKDKGNIPLETKLIIE